MSEHIPYPEEVRQASVDQALRRFCEQRRADLESITAADLAAFSNSCRGDRRVAPTINRLESVHLPGEMDKRF